MKAKNQLTKKLTHKINLAIELSKRLEEYLCHLEVLSDKSKAEIIKEALIQYIEDKQDEKNLGKAVKEDYGNKTYTSEELLKKLNL